MISAEHLSLLRCPESRQNLVLAPVDMVQKLNDKIRRKELRNKGGTVLERTFDAGLLRADSKVLYPIIDHIPILLIDEGVLLAPA